jgi:hypothetical protein
MTDESVCSQGYPQAVAHRPSCLRCSSGRRGHCLAAPATVTDRWGAASSSVTDIRRDVGDDRRAAASAWVVQSPKPRARPANCPLAGMPQRRAPLPDGTTVERVDEPRCEDSVVDDSELFYTVDHGVPHLPTALLPGQGVSCAWWDCRYGGRRGLRRCATVARSPSPFHPFRPGFKVR